MWKSDRRFVLLVQKYIFDLAACESRAVESSYCLGHLDNDSKAAVHALLFLMKQSSSAHNSDTGIL